MRTRTIRTTVLRRLAGVMTDGSTATLSRTDELRNNIRELLNQRSDARTELRAMTDAVEARGDSDFNATEQPRATELRETIRRLDAERQPLEERLAQLEADDAADEAARRSAERLPTTPDTPGAGGAQQRNADGTPRGGARIGAEPRTYSRAAERRDGISFIRDVVNNQRGGDMGAAERLARHMQEERVERAEYLEGIDSRGGLEGRASNTGSFAGLVVPQYLTDLVAPLTRNMRPFADICNGHMLPARGMTVELSRITTGTDADVQATEGTAVAEQDIDDTVLSVPVRTIAGSQDVSRQAIERGEGTDEIVVQDLVGAYHTRLDTSCLIDDGTGGTHTGIKNVAGNAAVTYTDASPTAAELFPKLADLTQQIQAATNMGLTDFVFHPRRWWWLATNLSSTFPLLQMMNGNNRQVGETGDTSYAANGAGILGANVVLDRNVETTLGGGTEDAIYGVDRTECHLWEDPNAPLLIRAEPSVKNLLVTLVVYGYSAFTAGRYPLSTGDITGTGLAAPTF